MKWKFLGSLSQVHKRCFEVDLIFKVWPRGWPKISLGRPFGHCEQGSNLASTISFHRKITKKSHPFTFSWIFLTPPLSPFQQRLTMPFDSTYKINISKLSSKHLKFSFHLGILIFNLNIFFNFLFLMYIYLSI